MNTASSKSASPSLNDKRSVIDEKGHHVTAECRDVDAAAQLSILETIDPKDAVKVRRKIDKHVLSLMCIVNWISFMDLTTLGNSAILGLKTDTHLNATQYNWLGTIYYVSLIVFEYPQNLALQRFPVGKWISLNILIWGSAICLHAACRGFGGLFVVRFILGVCQACIDSGFMIVTSMFYTRKEQTLRMGFWFGMNGASEIIGGFLSFGVLHIKTPGFEPWRWLMIICGILTLIIATCFWLLFPDSPTSAWFLSPEERVVAVNRIKVNQTGVENKHFKKEQVVDCVIDPKTWVFALYAFLRAIPNSLINQNNLIIQSFGFTRLQTTLLGSVPGVIKITTVYSGSFIASYFNSIAYTGVIYYAPSVVCAILVNVLPWSNKAGLLVSEYLVGVEALGNPISRAWLTQVTAGHTKRITTNAILLITDAIGNAIGPQIWLGKYAPRYHVPWAIIAFCYSSAAILLLVLRYMLNRENKRRDSDPPDTTYDDVWVKITNENEEVVEKQVDNSFLDLTDRQNREFRYAL